jgi:hypothetical protein
MLSQLISVFKTQNPTVKVDHGVKRNRIGITGEIRFYLGSQLGRRSLQMAEERNIDHFPQSFDPIPDEVAA